MPVVFRAVGVAVKRTGDTFTATVELVRVDGATVTPLRREALTGVASRADLLTQCQALVDGLARDQREAELAMNMAGRTLAQASV